MGDINAKNILTTGEVAKICRVSSKTVQKWVDNGLLAGFRLPGGKDRRILRNELVRFMKENNMPLTLLPSEES